MAVPTRKAPSTNTLRQLYVLSGNLCANPKCTTVLVNANGTMVAEVCHIKAESPGGPRFDSALSVEKRRASKNLILLCSTCHTLVDSEPRKYTVAVLRKWKRDRESRFAAVGDSLQQRYMRDIADESAATDLTKPKSLRAFATFLDADKCHHTIDSRTPSAVAGYVDRLKHISRPDRELLCAIVEKVLSLGGSRERDGLSVHPDDLKTLLVDGKRLSDYRIKKLFSTLDRHNLGSIDVDEEPTLYISVADEDLMWSDVKRFLATGGHALRDLVCDLKFALLD